ncbi:hypothetical protein V6N13_060020 [Hibiscus sabdariffa]
MSLICISSCVNDAREPQVTEGNVCESLQVAGVGDRGAHWGPSMVIDYPLELSMVFRVGRRIRRAIGCRGKELCPQRR